MPADLQSLSAPLRAAVIGCGWIGAGEAVNREVVGVQSHAEAYATHPRTSLSAVVDANLENAQKAATRWGAQHSFDNIAEMLRTVQPEIVSVCTPDALHAAGLMEVLDSCTSVRAILAEKPLALTVEEARAISAAAKARGVVLAVNYSRRYCPAYAQLRYDVASGALGDIQQVHGFYGKGLIHNGTHWIDLLRFLCGEVAELRALDLPASQADTPAVSMLLKNGASALLQPCRPDAFTLFEMDILGTLGRARLLAGGLHMEHHRVADSPYFKGYRELLPQGIEEHCMTNSIVHAVSDVITCLDQEGRQPACTAEDAIAALELALTGLRQPTPCS